MNTWNRVHDRSNLDNYNRIYGYEDSRWDCFSSIQTRKPSYMTEREFLSQFRTYDATNVAQDYHVKARSKVGKESWYAQDHGVSVVEPIPQKCSSYSPVVSNKLKSDMLDTLHQLQMITEQMKTVSVMVQKLSKIGSNLMAWKAGQHHVDEIELKKEEKKQDEGVDTQEVSVLILNVDSNSVYTSLDKNGENFGSMISYGLTDMGCLQYGGLFKASLHIEKEGQINRLSECGQNEESSAEVIDQYTRSLSAIEVLQSKYIFLSEQKSCGKEGVRKSIFMFQWVTIMEEILNSNIARSIWKQKSQIEENDILMFDPGGWTQFLIVGRYVRLDFVFLITLFNQDMVEKFFTFLGVQLLWTSFKQVACCELISPLDKKTEISRIFVLGFMGVAQASQLSFIFIPRICDLGYWSREQAFFVVSSVTLDVVFGLQAISSSPIQSYIVYMLGISVKHQFLQVFKTHEDGVQKCCQIFILEVKKNNCSPTLSKLTIGPHLTYNMDMKTSHIHMDKQNTFVFDPGGAIFDGVESCETAGMME